MFPHARKGHVEPLGKGCDRSVRTPELLQNAASGGVRERAERGIEAGLAILSHMVQYTTCVTVNLKKARPKSSCQTVSDYACTLSTFVEWYAVAGGRSAPATA